MGDNLKFSRNMFDTLAKLTNNLKMWNKLVYVHITTRKGYLIKKLIDIQKRMDLFCLNCLAKEELRVRQELGNVLHHEEFLWKQKARFD